MTKTKTYEASIKVLGKVFTAKGKSVYEALEKLKPGIAKGTAVLTVRSGEVSKDRIIPHVSVSRLFNTTGITRDVQLKNISLLFDGI